MQRGPKPKRRGRSQHAPEGASAQTEGQEHSARRRQRAANGSGAPWVGDKRAILRFVVILAVLIGAFNTCFYLWIANGSFLHGYLNVCAKVAAGVLTLFGDQVTAAGRSLASPRFSLSIEVGCDAVQASAFFVFAVLAAPASVSVLSRLPYVLLGLLFLSFLNLVRIVSLYYVGVYIPGAFDVMHIEVWQAVFIFVPLILWITWSIRVMRTEGVTGNVSN